MSDTVASRRNFIQQTSTLVAGASLLGLGSLAKADDSAETKNTCGRLTGKTAVVTGAARGIGRAIAVKLAKEGCDVMGIDIAGPVSSVLEVTPASKKDLDETEHQVKALGRKFISIVADVRDFSALKSAAARAEKEWGHIDIVVGNAGIQVFKALLDMEDKHWKDIIDVNLTGYANTIRAFAPSMVKKNYGRIILISSSQSRGGTKHGASYSASKWGVVGLMKSAAMELGEYKITVNAVIPGLVDTPLTRNPTRWREALAEDGKHEDHPSEKEVAEASKKKYPLGVPWLQPEDIAPAVAFLASDEAHMISGADYDVSAGFSAHYNA